MQEKTIYDRLNTIFEDVFDIDGITVTADTSADDIDEWDSLNHISLIGAVEDDFKLKFKMGEVSQMQNVGDMVEIIKARGTLD